MGKETKVNDLGHVHDRVKVSKVKGIPTEIAVLGSAPGRFWGRCPCRPLGRGLGLDARVAPGRCHRQSAWPWPVKKGRPVARTPRSAVPWVGALVDHRSTVRGLSHKVGAGSTNSSIRSSDS